ncbi:glycosyltransferase family 4 protein [Pilosibacter fragilis]|mgnify:CR=1 FL=1|uniref:glycosyltransferase family 4 protein n=1 Tax=Pilosibacter fragilis TaxID=3078042 RepID=UPI0032D34F09
MKVLFITGADQQYGTYQISKSLIGSMIKFDKTVEYIVVTQRHGQLNEWCKQNNIKNYVFPYRYCVYHPTNNRLLNIAKYVAKYVVVTISNIIALHKIECSGILEDIDIIHTNINRDLIGVLISRKYKVPNITHLREFSKSHFGLKLLYNNQIELMNKYNTYFIAISNSVKDDWVKFGLEREKIKVIYDGVNIENFEIKNQKNSAKELRLVMCGAIYEGKGQKELVQAVSKLIKIGLDIYLDIYGDVVNENYYNDMKRCIESENLQDRIRFLGYVNSVGEVFKNYDVGVICSKAEGFGLVTVEYMLSGLMVIASNTGANPELLQDGKYGQLYELNDETSLLSVLEYIYYNREQCRCIAEEAREYAKTNFSILNTMHLTNGIYCSLIRDK